MNGMNMDTSKYIIIGPIFMFVMMILFIGMTILKDKQVKNKRKFGVKAPAFFSLKTYNKMYIQLDKFFITRNENKRIKNRVAELGIYNPIEIKIVTVNFMFMTKLASLILIVIAYVIYRDLYTVILVYLYSIVVKEFLINRQIDSIYAQLLNELNSTLLEIGVNYKKSNGDISVALSECQHRPLIQNALNEISLILTAVNSDRRLEEFYACTPFKHIQTLAGISYEMNNSGDSTNENGVSIYSKALEEIGDEVKLEIRSIALKKSLFGMLLIVPIVPIFLLGGISRFFISQIPGTASIYNGVLGYAFKTIILVMSLVGFNRIVNATRNLVVRRDDRSNIITELLKKKKFSKIVENISPKKIYKIKAKNKLLRESLSKQTIESLYARKLLCALSAFVLSVGTTLIVLGISKDFIYNNINELSLTPSNIKYSNKDIEVRMKMDSDYLARPVRPSAKETERIISKSLPRLYDYDKQIQVQRLMKKYNLYHNAKMSWKYILLAYIFAILAWFIPERSLKTRAWMVKIESEEDILQMQTMISILMHTRIDTMNLLYWLYRQSDIHREMLLEAFLEYPSNPELALERLRTKTRSTEFHWIIDKLLLTIHQLELKDAFSDLDTERAHMLRMRELAQETNIRKKRNKVSPLATAPVYLTAFLYVVAPLLILGASEFVSAFKSLGM